MAYSIIDESLKRRIENDSTALYRVIFDLDQRPPEMSFAAASRRLRTSLRVLLAESNRTEQHVLFEGDDERPCVKARLQGETILKLVVALASPPLVSRVRPDADDTRYFNPDTLVRNVISVPLQAQIESDPNLAYDVQIEVNLDYERNQSDTPVNNQSDTAKEIIKNLISAAIAETVVIVPPEPDDLPQGLYEWKSNVSDQYVYAHLSGYAIQSLVRLDDVRHMQQSSSWKNSEAAVGSQATPRLKDWHTIYHIWPDFKLRSMIWQSATTIKADACRRSFATMGREVIWAVFDSGVDGTHPHFKKHSNLDLPSGLTHMDFTQVGNPVALTQQQLTDDYGHGTHVAGIIAGELDDTRYRAVALSREKDSSGRIVFREEVVTKPVMGIAPECTVMSCKVLDMNGEGNVSTVIAAIQWLQQLNGNGRELVVQGVNMSLGYDFDPEWFACGQSPLCVEVDRLVRSGVAVSIAAGNTGKGFALTINDPGNAQLAITVGATHRDMPHRYGVSYFSSKGPTADGRAKPDLLAPGERIVSCGAGPDVATYRGLATTLTSDPSRPDAYYLERSGTSMAAPHISGMVAGILSVRREFIGLPDDIKRYLVNNATDLGRERSFQGGGLADMIRTIQAM